jgi:tetratricopeptide (TPR) repeat protein
VLHSYIEECIAMSYEFELDHWPDLSKSRSNYLPLLKLAVDEEPNDDRSAHYYGRELMFNGKYEEAIIELKRHINLDSAVWIPEVANSMRYIARCYFNLGDIKNALYYSQMACIKCPEQREVWLEFAKIAYHHQDYVSAYYASTKCVSIKERELTYISEPEAWSELPWDILSISAYLI